MQNLVKYDSDDDADDDDTLGQSTVISSGTFGTAFTSNTMITASAI
jgi:hypothetical protein